MSHEPHAAEPAPERPVPTGPSNGPSPMGEIMSMPRHPARRGPAGCIGPAGRIGLAVRIGPGGLALAATLSLAAPVLAQQSAPPAPSTAEASNTADAASKADAARKGSILLTIFLRHDQSKTLDEINAQLRRQGYYDKFPPPGVEVASWYVMMGIGQVVTLRVPAERLREVNRVIEQTAWGGYRTEFYPTYDYKAVAEAERKKNQ